MTELPASGIYAKNYLAPIKWFIRNGIRGQLLFFLKRSSQLCLQIQVPQIRIFLLPRPSKEVLELLDTESPQLTKQIKAALEWQGRLLEPHYNRAMKPLWENLFLVGYGEVQDSSFPSLNVAASHTLLEDLWLRAQQMSSVDAGAILKSKLGSKSLFLSGLKNFRKNTNKIHRSFSIRVES